MPTTWANGYVSQGGTLDGSPYQYGQVYYPPTQVNPNATNPITPDPTKPPGAPRETVKKTPARQQGGFTKQDYIDLLEGLGLQGDVWDQLIDKAVEQEWSDSRFWAEVRQSKTFQHAFRGIELPNGKLRMSPAQYIQTRLQYKQAARTYGLHINNDQFGKAIGGNMSIEEFQDRLEAVQAVQENHQQWVEFARWAGLPSGGKDALDFMLGTAPKQFYSAWEKAQIGMAAANAGIGIGSAGSAADKLSKADVAYIAKQNPGWDPSQVLGGVKELATHMMTTMPQSQLYGYGITKQDLLNVIAGGPNADIVEQKIKRLKLSVGADINAKRATMNTSTPVDKSSQYNVKGD